MTNNRIAISGSVPQFDEREFNQHIADRRAEYYASQESHVHVRTQFLYDMITRVVELTTEGYTLSNKYPLNCAELQYDCFMRKPDQMMAEELVFIDAQVKQSYVAWLESEHERYRELLTAQLLQTAALKEQKKEEEKRAKLLKEIEREVADTFAPLVIPE